MASNWKDFVKSARTTAGGIDESPPSNWYDRRVYDASTGHQDPVKAVNDEIHRDWQRREAERKLRLEDARKKWSGRWNGFVNQAGRGFPIVDEYVNRAAVGLLGGATGILGGALEGACENGRNGTGFVEGIKNIGRNALTGAKVGARTGFMNPDLLNSALESKAMSMMGLTHHTLWDTEKRYQDRYHVSDPYYHNILVGGANAGGYGLKGASDLPFGVVSKGPNRELFMNGEIDKIEAAIAASLKRGEHPRVFGHSWGGADVANLAAKYPKIPFIALDPVSWTDTLDEYPDNLTVFFPKDGTNVGDNILARLAPVVGHRWRLPKKGRVIRYDGGHTSGVDEAVDAFNYREWARRDPVGFLSYYDEDGNRRPEAVKANANEIAGR